MTMPNCSHAVRIGVMPCTQRAAGDNDDEEESEWQRQQHSDDDDDDCNDSGSMETTMATKPRTTSRGTAGGFHEGV